MHTVSDAILTPFFARLHKVYLAFRMLNAGYASSLIVVTTFCNLLFSHLKADVLQTLQLFWTHWRYAHDFLEVFKHFPKKITCSCTWTFFQHVLNRWNLYQYFVQSAPLTPIGWNSPYFALCSCYGHIEDVHSVLELWVANFANGKKKLKCGEIFLKSCKKKISNKCK
jgi:hypothetical protein